MSSKAAQSPPMLKDRKMLCSILSIRRYCFCVGLIGFELAILFVLFTRGVAEGGGHQSSRQNINTCSNVTINVPSSHLILKNIITKNLS